MPDANDVRADFGRFFGTPAHLFRAPGRVNLIGEHTDYNNGFVMPAALGFATFAAISPRDDKVLEIYSSNLRQQISCRLDNPARSATAPWSNYVLGVAVKLKDAGYPIHG